MDHINTRGDGDGDGGGGGGQRTQIIRVVIRVKQQDDRERNWNAYYAPKGFLPMNRAVSFL